MFRRIVLILLLAAAAQARGATETQGALVKGSVILNVRAAKESPMCRSWIPLTPVARGQPGRHCRANTVEQAFQLIMQSYDISGPDPFRELVSKVLGLDLTRLPAGAFQNDFVLETDFATEWPRTKEECIYQIELRTRPSHGTWCPP